MGIKGTRTKIVLANSIIVNGLPDLKAKVVTALMARGSKGCANACEWVIHEMTLVGEILDTVVSDVNGLTHDLTINLDLLAKWTPDVTTVCLVELLLVTVVDGTSAFALERQHIKELAAVCVVTEALDDMLHIT